MRAAVLIILVMRARLLAGALLTSAALTGGTAALPAVAGADSFTAVPSLFSHYNVTGTLLKDGRALVGGMDFGTTLRTETFDPATGRWSAVTGLDDGPLVTLADGRVLVGSTTPDVYDPQTNTTSPAYLYENFPAQMGRGVTAIALADGTAFLADGYRTDDSTPTGGGYRYHPAGDAPWWTATSDPVSRTGAVMALLQDGSVLVAGGGFNGFATRAAALYQPSANYRNDAWAPTNPMITARLAGTATTLPDGRVLVTGGYDDDGPMASAELYTPSTGQWAPAHSMLHARQQHVAALLPNGRVLVAGGAGANDHPLSTELYDPAANTWTAGPDMKEAHASAVAVALRNGQVLIAGGTKAPKTAAGAELYTPDPPATLPGGDGGGGGGTAGGGSGASGGSGGTGAAARARAGRGPAAARASAAPAARSRSSPRRRSPAPASARRRRARRWRGPQPARSSPTRTR